MKQSTEKLWAMVSHLGMALTFSALGSMVIHLVFRDRSRFVGHHSGHAMWFFFMCWAVILVLKLTVIFAWLIPFVYGAKILLAAWGSFNAMSGKWYEYPLTSKIARRALH